MPVLLAPLALIGVALLSLIILYEYERLFGSPLDGLAKAVPVVGGYIAKGVDAAVKYGKSLLNQYVVGYIDKLVNWFTGLAQSVQGFVESVNAFIVALPGQLDHLTHVTVHEIVKSFVNPVRATAETAAGDATHALKWLQAVDGELTAKFKGIEGSVEQAIDHATNVIRNVDLPNLEHVLRGETAQAIDGVEGDLGQVQDWAGGWIDYLLDRYNGIPLNQLIEGAAAGTAAYALAQVIANEAGLSRAECRAKVKGICGTDPNAWAKLLASVVPLFALPALDEIVSTAQALVGELLPAVKEIGGMS